MIKGNFYKENSWNGFCGTPNSKGGNIESIKFSTFCFTVAINYETVGKAVRKAVKGRNCAVELEDNWSEDIVAYHEKKRGES